MEDEIRVKNEKESNSLNFFISTFQISIVHSELALKIKAYSESNSKMYIG